MAKNFEDSARLQTSLEIRNSFETAIKNANHAKTLKLLSIYPKEINTIYNNNNFWNLSVLFDQILKLNHKPGIKYWEQHLNRDSNLYLKNIGLFKKLIIFFNPCNTSLKNALNTAIEQNDIRATKLILNQSENVNNFDNIIKNMIDNSNLEFMKKTCSYLKTKGYNFNMLSGPGQDKTPLYYAALSDRKIAPEIIKLLVDHGADPTLHVAPLISVAAHNKNPEILQTLLKLDMPPNHLSGDYKHTAGHIVIIDFNFNCISKELTWSKLHSLVEHGADLTIKDGAELTVFDDMFRSHEIKRDFLGFLKETQGGNDALNLGNYIIVKQLLEQVDAGNLDLAQKLSLSSGEAEELEYTLQERKQHFEDNNIIDNLGVYGRLFISKTNKKSIKPYEEAEKKLIKSVIDGETLDLKYIKINSSNIYNVLKIWVNEVQQGNPLNEDKQNVIKQIISCMHYNNLTSKGDFSAKNLEALGQYIEDNLELKIYEEKLIKSVIDGKTLYVADVKMNSSNIYNVLKIWINEVQQGIPLNEDKQLVIEQIKFCMHYNNLTSEEVFSAENLEALGQHIEDNSELTMYDID